MGASCGDAREGAGLPAGPAGSVSQAAQRHGGGDAGPPRTILTAARPAARAPATRLAAAGARAYPPPPAPGGGGAGRGGARGLTRGGRSGGGAGPRGRARGDGDARRSTRLGCSEASGCTPLSRGGRRRFRASCATSVSPAALTSRGVSSRAFIGRARLGSSPSLPTPPSALTRKLRPVGNPSAGSPGKAMESPGRVTHAPPLGDGQDPLVG
ncbi:uncharacterized protein LOC142837217 [Microtus pennsylvanicus]|uniref:uncharacterized protein LOC142837217 n=1 Tax=Microtus pennsylvanicus TaxID=10058 RepID=UPI003F6AB720